MRRSRRPRGRPPRGAPGCAAAAYPQRSGAAPEPLFLLLGEKRNNPQIKNLMRSGEGCWLSPRRLQRGERDLQVSGREGGRGGRQRGPAVLTAGRERPAGGQTPWPAMGDRRCGGAAAAAAAAPVTAVSAARGAAPGAPSLPFPPARPPARSYSAPPASHVDGAEPPRLLLGAGQGNTRAAGLPRAVRGAALSDGCRVRPLPYSTFSTCSPDHHPEVPSIHPHRWDTNIVLVGIPEVMAAGRKFSGRKFSAPQG